MWFTQEPLHKAAPCSHTLSRANPSTNTHKGYAKPKNLINEYLDGLEKFSGMWVASHEFQQAQMTQGEVYK